MVSATQEGGRFQNTGISRPELRSARRAGRSIPAEGSFGQLVPLGLDDRVFRLLDGPVFRYGLGGDRGEFPGAVDGIDGRDAGPVGGDGRILRLDKRLGVGNRSGSRDRCRDFCRLGRPDRRIKGSSDRVARRLWQMVLCAGDDLLEPLARVLELDVLGGRAGELLGHEVLLR